MKNKEYTLTLLESFMICKAMTSVDAAKGYLAARKNYPRKHLEGPESKALHKKITALCKKRIARGTV